MSSSTLPNNQTIEYPNLPAISAPPLQDDANNNAADETALVITDTASNNVSNDGPNQAPPTQRQLRSSGPPSDISLHSVVTEAVTPEERQTEILRIVNGGPDEALSSYHAGTNAEMREIYRSLSRIVHPDRQSEDRWKERAGLAQQILNEARAKFAAPDDVPEPEIGAKPGARHRTIWNLPRFVGTVRRLHIDPDNPTAVAMVAMTNTEIGRINAEEGLSTDCGTFPLRYLQHNYRSAHKMLKSYTESNDAEQKANKTIIFKSFAEATKDFCRERDLPLTWAWDCEDIGRLPDYLTEYEASENQAGPTPDQQDVPMGDHAEDTAGPTPGQQDVPMGDHSEDTAQPSSSNPAILYKRNVFKRTQYLVQERSGLHVWKEESECEDVDSNQIRRIMKPTRSYVRERKRQYKGIGWIAMASGDAITNGAGQFPPITLNVEWRDGAEDTPLWRSEVIKMVGEKRVGQDMQTHLPYTKMVEYGGQRAFVMAPTASGLTYGEQKAIERIQNQKFKPEKAAQLAASVSAQARTTVPANAQPAVTQSTIFEPTVPQTAPAPQPAQPPVNQQGSVQPASTQAAVAQAAPTQSTVPQPVDPQTQMIMQLLAGLSQRPAVTQSTIFEPTVPQTASAPQPAQPPVNQPAPVQPASTQAVAAQAAPTQSTLSQEQVQMFQQFAQLLSQQARPPMVR